MNMYGTRFLTELADVCRKSGLEVVEVDGWQTRTAAPNRHNGTRYADGKYGGPGMEPIEGIVVHHTATPESYHPERDYPTYAVILRGNGSTGGPLSQLGHCRCGRHVYVFAAGICWHAGPFNDRRFANPRAIGIEAEHSGQPSDMPWPKARYEGYVALTSTLADHYRVPVKGHKEISTLGKIDPLFDMGTFRRDVAAWKSGSPVAPAVPDWQTPDHLRRVQTLLEALGYDPGPIDGKRGPLTEAATALFQADYGGLTVDGSPGPNTLAALEDTMKAIFARFDALEAKLDDAPRRVWDHRLEPENARGVKPRAWQWLTAGNQKAGAAANTNIRAEVVAALAGLNVTGADADEVADKVVKRLADRLNDQEA